MAWLTSLMLLVVGPSLAQTAHDPWMTVETEHFRIHYPKSAEDWALQGADHMESIRDRVIEEVGWTHEGRIDIVIRDPMSVANGSAIPFLGAPRMEFWSTPPDAASVIGHYRTWGELLLTHEYAHQAHLLRTSRNPSEQLLEGVTGIGSLARKCPRWVSEGYATVVEARLSGFGRPNASYRAAFLRRLAQEGQMPTYGGLNNFDRFSGGAFAYLVGSAYLEWLDERAGGDSLVKLWRRLTAVKVRDFDEAFSGLYGASPERLYARFVAELSHGALEIESQRVVDENTLWKELTWYTGEPAVSPDGEKIAVVVRSRKGPARLKVWSTGDPDEEALEDRREAREKRLEKDPEDVLSLEPRHPPRKELAERVRTTRTARQPRFMPDSDAVLFTAFAYDASGRRRPDLYLWNHASGEERRVTVNGDVRTADPAPDGSFAIAVGLSWGRTHLVRVDLETGAVEPITEPDVDIVYDAPRISPDGERVAYLVQRGAGWEIEVLDFGTGTVTQIGGGERAGIPSHLAWGPSSQSLYASVGVGGFMEVHEVLSKGGRGRQITRSRGGAIAPAPTPDGAGLFYLSMDYTGLELHRLSIEDVGVPTVNVSADSPLVVPRPGPVVPPLDVGEREDPHRYGLGPTELRPLVGGAWSVSQKHIEMGVRGGDIVGRRDGLLMVAYGGETGVTGALGGFGYRGLPVEIRTQAFTAIEEPESLRRYGGVLSFDGERAGSALSARARLGGFLDRAFSDPDSERQPPGNPSDRQVGFGELGLAAIGPRAAAMGVQLKLRGQLGVTDGALFHREELWTAVWVGRDLRLAGRYDVGFSNAVSDLDRYRLGGSPSAVLPETWQWTRVQSPGFVVGSLRGANRDRVRVELAGLGPGAIFGERHRMEDGPLGGPGATLVGLDGAVDVDPQPYGKLPALKAAAGLGCQLEEATDGWDSKPCQTLEDYRAWVSATWTI